MVPRQQDRNTDHIEDEDEGEEASVDVDEGMSCMSEGSGLPLGGEKCRLAKVECRRAAGWRVTWRERLLGRFWEDRGDHSIFGIWSQQRRRRVLDTGSLHG